MELKDTIDGMVSPDYKERELAEFQQVEIRCAKLLDLLQRWDAGELDFEPTTPRAILDAQLNAMCAYMRILQYRAELEGVI